MMLIEYLSAESTGNEKLARVLKTRFRPDVQKAINSWLATKPFENPDAPRSPFVMKEYSTQLKEKAAAYEDLVEQKIKEASDANRNGDNYILLTVLFASVLFFAGICVKFQSRRVKAAMLIFGVIMFMITALVLISYPVTWSGVAPAPIT